MKLQEMNIEERERGSAIFILLLLNSRAQSGIQREREVGSGLEVGAWLDGGEPSRIYRRILLRIRPYVP